MSVSSEPSMTGMRIINVFNIYPTVVSLLLLRVRKDLVRLANSLELSIRLLLLRIRLAALLVGVELECRLSRDILMT